jgi:hypothetical protein
MRFDEVFKRFIVQKRGHVAIYTQISQVSGPAMYSLPPVRLGVVPSAGFGERPVGYRLPPYMADIGEEGGRRMSDGTLLPNTSR